MKFDSKLNEKDDLIYLNLFWLITLSITCVGWQCVGWQWVILYDGWRSLVLI